MLWLNKGKAIFNILKQVPVSHHLRAGINHAWFFAAWEVKPRVSARQAQHQPSYVLNSRLHFSKIYFYFYLGVYMCMFVHVCTGVRFPGSGGTAVVSSVGPGN